MVAKGFIVDFLGKSAGALTDTKKKEEVKSGSYPNFNDTLNSAVNKSLAVNGGKSIQKNAGVNDNKRIDRKFDKTADTNNQANARGDRAESDSKIKSYKDAVKKNEQVSAKKEEKSSEIKSVDKNEKLEKSPEKETAKLEGTVIEESLAQILNISVEELKKVMSTLNISSEELADKSKTAEIAGRISDFFGLDSSQKATLLKIAEFTVNESKSLLGEMKNQDSQEAHKSNKEDWVKLEGVKVEVVENDIKAQPQDVAPLGNKLKEILNQLETKLETEPERLYKSILDNVKEIVAQEVAVSQTKEITDTTMLTGKSTAETGKVDNAEEIAAKDNTDDKTLKTAGETSESEGKQEDTSSSDQKSERLVLRKADTIDKQGLSAKDAEQTQFDNILNNQQIKTNIANEVSKVQNEASVSKKEIVSQIIEKARVVLTDEKSEMVIDLKPDHLGKLSLKVVTERGAVVAKFVAESEQVKAAIESNMDSLKESLTKQGFSVQGFSVSVGQDSQKGFAKGYESPKNNNRTGNVEKVSSNAAVGVSTIEENQNRLNPYMISNSSINLTA